MPCIDISFVHATLDVLHTSTEADMYPKSKQTIINIIICNQNHGKVNNEIHAK
jgi:hypothetical protein